MLPPGTNAVRSYLYSQFPGVTVELSSEAREGKKNKEEVSYLATMFRVRGLERTLFVSDVLLYHTTELEITGLLRQHEIAKELWEVGSHPLLLVPEGPLLILDWRGPLELTTGAIEQHAPRKGGVYILVSPPEGQQCKPLFVDQHDSLRSQLQLFVRTKEFGKVPSCFFSLLDDGVLAPDAVRSRVTKFIARTCGIDDPAEPQLKPLAVNLPPGLTRAGIDPHD